VWWVAASPATQVPSHGTHFLGQTFAFDLVGVDEERHSSGVRDWRSVLWFEPPERFIGFGRAVHAPASGTIVAAHDGEPDGVARRSLVGVLAFDMRQRKRLARNLNAVLGNHVILALEEGVFALLAHLRRGSLRVNNGDHVRGGQAIAACGNSGNSTEPHLHFQLMDSVTVRQAVGRPVAFRHYEAWTERSGWRSVPLGVPACGELVRPGPARPR
jgi:murein DD-endopeptidase MepM/ murein hydrolase activator NlpD